MYEVSIPKTNDYQSRGSAFQWTLTLIDEPREKYRYQFSSSNSYEEIEKVEINGFTYEKLIFDFENGKLHISLKQRNPKAIHNVLKSLTIHTSPTSKMYFLKQGRKRPNREK